MQTKPAISWSEPSFTVPPWMGTPMTNPKVLLPGGGFLDESAIGTLVLTIAVGAVADNATTLSVTAPETVTIPKGSILSFASVDGLTVADDVIVTADHEVGAIASALPVTGIGTTDKPAAGMVSTYALVDGRKHLADGTLVGRTYAQREAGEGLKPVNASNVAVFEQFFLTAFPISDVTQANYVELYMPGNVVYEERLPGWADLPASVQAQIRALFQCIKF
jgi:hypothetical protein